MRKLRLGPRVFTYVLSAGLVAMGAIKLAITGSVEEAATIWTAGGTIILMLEAAIANNVALAEHSIHETEHRFQTCTAEQCPVLGGLKSAAH